MCSGDGGIGGLEIAQLIGVAATVFALVFTALELRASTRERKQLRRRIQQERLEDLAIAVARARNSVMRLDVLDVERDLAEIRARAIPLPEGAYPDLRRFANESFSPEDSWTQDLHDRLRKLADAAQLEIHGALTGFASVD